MTTVLEKRPVDDTDRPVSSRWSALAGPALANRWTRTMIYAAGFLFLLSFVREVTGAEDITSSGTAGAALRLAVPIAMAGLGGLYSERCGIVNIGLEGMMILGTWFGAWAGWQWGPWWGVVAAILGGALGGLLHGIATITFGVDHVVSGVAINILGPGITRYLATAVFTGQPGASATLSPPVKGSTGKLGGLPFVSGGSVFGWHTPDFFGWLEGHHWFFVSDLGGALKGVTSDLATTTVIAVLLFVMTGFVLWRTSFGLRLRSIGEAPDAADSLGVPVIRMKYIAVCISGGLAGFGGWALVEAASRFREGQTGGRGYIGLAALIFGNWRPLGVAAGAGLFGFADALQLRSAESVRALLLFVTILLGLLGLRAILKKRVMAAVIALGLGAGLGTYYAVTDHVAQQFVFITPYLTTLLVLAFASQRLRPPAAAGRRWRKGQQS